MPCLYPRQVFFRYESDFKKSLIWQYKKQHLADDVQKVPCGNCKSCRLEKSREQGVRMAHECSMYENNCFITLTYAPEFLPKNESLDVEVPKLFMKRLRSRDDYERECLGLPKRNVRVYYCGEYGETCVNCGFSKFKCKCERFLPQLGRPHYHMILFNYSFKDVKFFKSHIGNSVYTSEFLSEVWGKGFCTIGEVNFQSCCYVARYCMKKVNGLKAPEHYRKVLRTGEIVQVLPEFAQGSRNPGIGKPWFDKYKMTDIYNDDRIVLSKDVICKPPRYYDKKLKELDPDLMEEIKQKRYENWSSRYLRSVEDEGSENRIRQREKHVANKLRLLVRSMEEGD